MKTYLLFEIANSCAGSPKLIKQLIDSLPRQTNTGVKFQVYKYDEIALSDYEWYPVYKQTFINAPDWKRIFSHTKNRGLDIWIDIFDLYGVKVLKDNLRLVTGVKMQSSVLDNLKVLETLSETINNTGIKVILNVAGRDLNNIKDTIANLKAKYFKNEIILQAGFQGYPTDKEDLAIGKVGILKSEFPNTTISYADHVDGRSPLAFDVPAYAVLAGAKHIEKHICLDRKTAKYDHQSAIEPDEFNLLIYRIKEAEKMLGEKFIPDKEANYLKSTIEKPIASTPLKAGDIINFKNFNFRRTNQPGLTVAEIKDFMHKGYILGKDIKPGRPLIKSDLKKARVGVIIACRMKSTRLKQKAILPIGNLAAIERCIINAKKIKSANEVILATSTLAEDQILKKYAQKHKIHFFAGDPEDVMLRFLKVAEKYKLDMVIRITGDCPVVSYEMAEYQLKKHFKDGNDYTGPKSYVTGLVSEVYNVNTFKKIMSYLGNARHSEYMTWYILSNPHVFQIGAVEFQNDWFRKYRLTLDFQEDLDMLRALFNKLGPKEPNIKNIYEVLDKNLDIPEINGFLSDKYKTDKKLITMLNKETKIKL